MSIFQKIRSRTTTATEPSDDPTVRRLRRSVLTRILIVIVALLLAVVLIFAMSVAWFTNVAQSSGLRLKTQAWGFDEKKITVPESPIDAYPGGSGFIPLTIDNSDSQTGISATANIDKAQLDGENPLMPAELQQRIYFYIDEVKKVTFASDVPEISGTEVPSDETVSCVYIGSDSDHSYTWKIAGGEKLTLADDYYSDAPLKWKWVLDLEGYYFKGCIADGSVTVHEYIRPIEYDLDSAVFDREPDSSTRGELKSVGGSTANEFLKGVFDSDGYRGTLKLSPDGTVDPNSNVTVIEVNGKRYYKVAADSNGEGIWAYLLTEDEIREATAYDTAMKDHETSLTAILKITVSNLETEAVDVSNADTLRDAVANGDGRVVRLCDDITLDAPCALEQNRDVSVDLNGYTVTYGAEGNAYALFTVPSDSSLLLRGGEVRGNGSGSSNASNAQTSAVTTNGGRATLSGVRVRDLDCALFIDDRNIDADSTVKVVNCDFDTPCTAVNLYGNGDGSDARTRLIVQGTKIRGGYFGISGNGSTSNYGTDIVIMDSEVEGKWAAIYQPQRDSKTAVSGSKLTGYTGAVVKGGTVTFTDSEVKGMGAHAEPAAAAGGFTDTGDGIYVEATYTWSAGVVLHGAGNRISSVNSYAIDLFGVKGRGPGRMVCDGGTLAGALGATKFNDIGTFTVSDSTEQNGKVGS